MLRRIVWTRTVVRGSFKKDDPLPTIEILPATVKGLYHLPQQIINPIIPVVAVDDTITLKIGLEYLSLGHL